MSVFYREIYSLYSTLKTDTLAETGDLDFWNDEAQSIEILLETYDFLTSFQYSSYVVLTSFVLNARQLIVRVHVIQTICRQIVAIWILQETKSS